MDHHKRNWALVTSKTYLRDKKARHATPTNAIHDPKRHTWNFGKSWLSHLDMCLTTIWTVPHCIGQIPTQTQWSNKIIRARTLLHRLYHHDHCIRWTTANHSNPACDAYDGRWWQMVAFLTTFDGDLINSWEIMVNRRADMCHGQRAILSAANVVSLLN